MSDIVPQDIPLKQCKACLNWFPATSAYFHKKATNRDKLQKKCKRCCGSSMLGLTLNRNGDATRECTKCHKILPATSEYFQKHSDGGLQPRCKSCRKEEQVDYYNTHKEKTNARNKQYRERNQEQVRAHRKAYWVTSGKAIEARRKLSLEANPLRKSRRSQRGREYYYKHRERISARNRRYYRLHRDLSYARGRNRQARIASIPGTHTAAQIAEQLKRQHYKCYYAACGHAKFKKVNGKYVYHVDHTFPVARIAGTGIPGNDMSYLVLACPSCNISKNDRFPWEWPEGGRLL